MSNQTSSTLARCSNDKSESFFQCPVCLFVCFGGERRKQQKINDFHSIHIGFCFVLFVVGGFAFVYVVQDTQNGTEYALKRLLGSDKQACNNIIRELNIHKQLSGHPNIVKYVAASFIDHTNSAKANAEYLLVSELCKGGSLIHCMGTSAFEPDTILKIVYQISKAIAHMHNQNPPITHRDIKVIAKPKKKNSIRKIFCLRKQLTQ